MHRGLGVTVALSVLLLAGCAHEMQDARPEASEQDLEALAAAYNEKVDDPSQEIVCEKEAKVGTRIKEVVCRTRAQMAQEHRDGRRYFDRPRPVPWQDGPRVPGT